MALVVSLVGIRKLQIFSYITTNVSLESLKIAKLLRLKINRGGRLEFLICF